MTLKLNPHYFLSRSGGEAGVVTRTQRRFTLIPSLNGERTASLAGIPISPSCFVAVATFDALASETDTSAPIVIAGCQELVIAETN